MILFRKTYLLFIIIILSVLAGCGNVSGPSDSSSGGSSSSTSSSSSSSSGSFTKGHVYMKIERDPADLQYIEISAFSIDPSVNPVALSEILSGTNFQISLTNLHFNITFTGNLKDQDGNVLIAYNNTNIDIGDPNDTSACDLNTYDYFWGIKFELAVNKTTGDPEIKILGNEKCNTSLAK